MALAHWPKVKHKTSEKFMKDHCTASHNENLPQQRIDLVRKARLFGLCWHFLEKLHVRTGPALFFQQLLKFDGFRNRGIW
jgi:hypothetical protein